MTDEPVRVEARDGNKGPGQRVVSVSGRLVFPNAELRFLERIRVETAPAVILDLSGVTFCDSSGVGALMQIHNTFKRENRRLALAAVNERAAFALRIAQVLSLFTVFPTLAEAEEQFG
jgi:anti-anti-sigma factor